MKRIDQLLLENKAWSMEMVENDPQFFVRQAQSQSPEFLWIGCSDSRVSPTDMTHTPLGEMFIHRNIANVVVHTDMNLLSVMQYAVDVLKIKHIIVCGHYGCGGVRAALTRESYGTIDKWLLHIKDVYRLHRNEIDAIQSEEQKVDTLVEKNVLEQLYNVARTTIVQKAWERDNAPALHGWVYNMKTGLIQPLLTLEPGANLDYDIYRYNNLSNKET